MDEHRKEGLSRNQRQEHTYVDMMKAMMSGTTHSFYTQATDLSNKFLISHNYVLVKAVDVTWTRTRLTHGESCMVIYCISLVDH